MSIPVQCRCGYLYSAPDNLVGRTVSCPECKALLDVPIPEEFPELDSIGLEPEGIPTIDAVEVLEDEDTPTLYGLAGGGGGVQKGVTGELGQIRVADTEPVSCLAYAADHTRALAAAEDTIHILDLEAQKRLGMVRKHRAAIACMAISPDSRQVLSGDESGGLLLWDLDRGHALRWLEGHEEEVSSVAFAPNGRYAVSGGADGSTRLWELASGKQFDLLKACWSESVNCVSFSPAGKLILAIGAEGKTRVWSVKTGEPLGNFQPAKSDMTTVTFSPAGDFFLAATDRAFDISKWDLRTGKRSRCFRNFANRQMHVRRTYVVPGGRLILTACEYREWSRHRARDIKEVARKASVVFGIAGAAVTYSVMTGPGTTRFALQAWDVANESPVMTVDCGHMEPRMMAGSPDGHRALVAFRNGMISIFGL